MQIVLDTYGLNLSVRNGCFLMATESEKRMVHPSRVTSILIVMPCRLSSPAIILAATHEIPITICNKCGKPEARLWSPRFFNIATLRRKQYEFAKKNESIDWLKTNIHIKITGQIRNLQYMADRKPGLQPLVTESIEKMTANMNYLGSLSFQDLETAGKRIRWLEASSAQVYWQLIGTRLPTPFTFTNRIKKAPTDGFNACINFLYGMLRNQVETAILSMGLDPALGILHRDGYKMPSLVFDMMEPFRPVVDRILMEAILKGIKVEVLEKKEDLTYTLTRPCRKMLITLFNDKLASAVPFKSSNQLFKNQILSEVNQLVNCIKQDR